MREKLNENPIAQIALVGVLIIAAAVMFMSRMGGSEEEESASTTEATVAVAGSGATGTATGATPGEAVEGASEAAIENAAAEATAPAAVSAASLHAPPPPPPLMRAYRAGDTVVLLVVHNGGIDDRMVRAASTRLESMSNVALFVVSASHIARYAAITLGVEVSRVPAMIVLRPRRLSQNELEGAVSYGYQSPKAVVQAVRDAAYSGPPTSYHPE